MKRNVTIDDTVLIVSDEGNYFENAETGRVYTIFKNKHRRNRECINIKNKMCYTNRIVAKAFPEICGEWFDGCQVHHKDRNPSNNRADNLEVVSKEAHKKEHKGEFVELVAFKNAIPVHQYTLDGEYVQTFSSSMEAARYIGKSMSAIRNCLCGISNTAFGYRWVHSPEPTMFIEKTPTAKENMREKIGKKITNGELVFNSVTEAAEHYGVGPSAIGNCLKGRNQSCCGFKWRYLG